MSLDEEKKEVVVATEEAPAKPNFLDYKIITQEMRDEFKEAFTLYDKDNDGFINLGHQNDLGLIMRALGEDPSEEEMTEMAKGFQTDGRLNYESFVAMMEDHIKNSDPVKDVAEVFRVFDKNKDGTITSADFKHIMQNLGEKLTDEEMVEVMADAKVDANGNVDYVAFVKVMIAAQTKRQ